jgi:hypothetical protein
MGAIAAGALMAGRQAAQATQKLQKGVSPGVRASGPFAKQIAQAQASRNQVMKNPMRVAGKALGGMGSKFGK